MILVGRLSAAFLIQSFSDFSALTPPLRGQVSAVPSEINRICIPASIGTDILRVGTTSFWILL
jgi:hypothetical protein